MYEVFYLRGTTRCGAPFLCGGLSRAGSGAACRASLAWPEQLDFSDERFQADPASVDQAAAAAAANGCSREVLALGLTVRRPGLAWRTGGVLGSPHAAARAAASRLEEIGPDLWLYAVPGGPGLVCAGAAQDVAAVLAGLGAGRCPADAAGMRALYASLAARRRLETFLGLSDGSGPAAAGVLFGQAGNGGFFEIL
jgi:hypothetical protein